MSSEKYAALADALQGEPLPDGRKKHFLIPDWKRIEHVLQLRQQIAPKEGASIFNRIKSVLSSLVEVKAGPRTLGRRICIVGVHGWFPTKVLQTVVGVPKGTSARLCAMMSEVTREYLDKQPLAYFEIAPRIDCVPLEGEGCILERTDRHFAQLTDAIDGGKTGKELIEKADSVVFVAHSQGAPVTALLVDRMINVGMLNPARQNVGILTLAGVFHGPFTPLRENLVVRYVEADAARELFDLNDPKHPLTGRINDALVNILSKDVMMTCVASWLDQVVPLHSATLLGVEHANIWRAVYIDAHNYKPDFLSQLIATSLTLANAQIPGSRELVAQLGSALAGSLYQSNAHSTLYHDHGVYEVILRWMCAMDRGATKVPSLHLEEMLPRHEENPYGLPWTMRGILANQALTKHPMFTADMSVLKELHRKWRPDRKVWKDLRLQLEPLSKL
jgi:hypothetical protein